MYGISVSRVHSLLLHSHSFKCIRVFLLLFILFSCNMYVYLLYFMHALNASEYQGQTNFLVQFTHTKATTCMHQNVQKRCIFCICVFNEFTRNVRFLYP